MEDPTRNDYFESGRMRIYNTEMQPSHPGSEFVSQKYHFYYDNAIRQRITVCNMVKKCLK